jgi:aspartate aminotransferase
MVTQSFAKCMGLYDERIGAFHVVTQNAEVAVKVKSQIAKVIRPMYSNPPNFGARVVSEVLGNPTLRKEWDAEISTMCARILSTRRELHRTLVNMGTPGNWDHIIAQRGMFSFTGLSPEQCDVLMKEFHVYLLRSGRISLCGLNPKNTQYVARAIDAAVR